MTGPVVRQGDENGTEWTITLDPGGTYSFHIQNFGDDQGLRKVVSGYRGLDEAERWCVLWINTTGYLQQKARYEATGGTR